MAQLAALEESSGDVGNALVHNQLAQETFLAIGDGAGLVQTFRVDAFLHLRGSEYTTAAHSFAKALGLALQLDGRLVLTTLNQVVPAAKYLIESDKIWALLPLGVALAQAVESAEAEQMPELRDFAELAETVAGCIDPTRNYGRRTEIDCHEAAPVGRAVHTPGLARGRPDTTALGFGCTGQGNTTDKNALS